MVGLGAFAAARMRRPQRIARRPQPRAKRFGPVALSATVARDVDRSAALLALLALADSGLEHYRGSFHNRVMYVPLGVAATTMVACLRDAASGSRRTQRSAAVPGLAITTGIVGTGFHIYNIAKRPGGISWLNLFYAAPLGAPAALSLAGLLDGTARLLRRDRHAFAGAPLARLLAGIVAAGLVGSSAEAGLLHFRGAYHNPAMVIPVIVPPAAAFLLARAAMCRRGRHAPARWMLLSLAAIGLAGTGFHAYGVQRNMGGWRNLSQNLLNGPPLPAPPAFTALAIAGLAALRLIETGA